MGGPKSKVIAKNTVDVVYIMDTRSKRQDIELMFSLRSVKKYLRNYRKIHIVGADMSGVVKATGVIKHHITPPTEGNNHQIKKHNLLDIICENQLISDEFVLISDDCFLLERHDANKIPFCYDSTITNRLSKYRNQLSASLINLHDTLGILKENKRKDRYFNTHTPLLINKKDFLGLRDHFYIEEFERGLLYKTLYCNFYKKRGTSTKTNLIHNTLTRKKLNAKLKKAKNFAVQDNGLTLDVIKFLYDRFPDKLSWEK